MKIKSMKAKIAHHHTAGSERIVKDTTAAHLPRPKPYNPTMTTPLTVPSERIWNNIEKVLDEQDNRRHIADQIIADSFDNAAGLRRRMFFLAIVAGSSVLAGIFWLRF